MEDLVNVLLVLGGIIMVLAAVPQLIKLTKTRSSKDFSILWTSLTLIAIGFMEPYGVWLSIEKNTIMFLVTNTACFLIQGRLLQLVLKYKGGS